MSGLLLATFSPNLREGASYTVGIQLQVSETKFLEQENLADTSKVYGARNMELPTIYQALYSSNLVPETLFQKLCSETWVYRVHSKVLDNRGY